MDIGWEDDIYYILENYYCLKKVDDEGGCEYQYFDEFNNLVLKKNYLAKNKCTYRLYKHSYDLSHNILQTMEYIDGKLISKIKFAYTDGKLVNKTIYKKKEYIEYSDQKGENKADDLNIESRHFYTYYLEQLIEEKVCLQSGDVSYYKVYNEDKIQWLNPFHMLPQWSLDSIEDGVMGVTVKEKDLTSTVFDEIVKEIHDHYPTYKWVVMDTYSSFILPEENIKISRLLQEYEKKWDLRVDFG